MEFEDVAESIELPDHTGRRRVAFRPRGLSAGAVVADVTVTMAAFESARASELSLTAVPLRRSKLTDLDAMLATWLDERTPFEIALAGERRAELNFTVGPDADHISTLDKPVFRIDVNWCGISAVAVLTVDPSCMRIFHEGVSGWLRLGRAATG